MITRTRRNAQRGAILIVALLFLTILTILGVTAMTTTTHEEKMAGYSRDTAVAFQAAEAALRDARRDINGIVIPPFNTPRNPLISKATGFGDGNTPPTPGACGTSTVAPQTIGLCWPFAYDGNTSVPPVFNNTVSLTASPSVEFGAFTGALMPATLLSRRPRYFIEVLCYVPPGESFGGSSGDFCNFYRITAAGYGGNPNTRVIVQEIFLRP
jgi:type IV pilus assembly protein PilX